MVSSPSTPIGDTRTSTRTRARMFNRDPASLIGKHIWTEFPGEFRGVFHAANSSARCREGIPRQIEAYSPPYDRWFENSDFPVRRRARGLLPGRHRPGEDCETIVCAKASSAIGRCSINHPDAVYSFDADGRFTSANAACERLTGYRLEAIDRHVIHSARRAGASPVGPSSTFTSPWRVRRRATTESIDPQERSSHRGQRSRTSRSSSDGKVVGVYGIAQGSHRATRARGPAAPGAEDGSGRTTGGGCRTRLQQPTHGHPELRHDALARSCRHRRRVTRMRQAILNARAARSS